MFDTYITRDNLKYKIHMSSTKTSDEIHVHKRKRSYSHTHYLYINVHSTLYTDVYPAIITQNANT